MAVEYDRRVFTVGEYYRMAEAGILSEDDRVELIEGEIVKMCAIGSRHAACVNRLSAWFFRQQVDEVIVSIQNPISLDEYSEPEPDIALLAGRDDFYASSHPKPEEVRLIIEVSDTS